MSTLSERIPNILEVPFEVRKAFANAGDPTEEFRAHTTLWREVVARAVMDALGFTGQSEPDRHNSILLDARVWLRSGDSLVEVFENADLPLEIIRGSMVQNFAKNKVVEKTKRESSKKSLLTAPARKATAESKSKRKRNVKADKTHKPKRDSSRKRLHRTKKNLRRTSRVRAKAAGPRTSRAKHVVRKKVS